MAGYLDSMMNPSASVADTNAKVVAKNQERNKTWWLNGMDMLGSAMISTGISGLASAASGALAGATSKLASKGASKATQTATDTATKTATEDATSTSTNTATETAVKTTTKPKINWRERVANNLDTLGNIGIQVGTGLATNGLMKLFMETGGRVEVKDIHRYNDILLKDLEAINEYNKLEHTNEPTLNDILTYVNVNGYRPIYAEGGEVDSANVPIEAEGGEMIEHPGDDFNGQYIQGPDHQDGGVRLDVPEGTKIYSKRIKDDKGRSMADRKLKRDAFVRKWVKEVEKDPTNKIKRATLERVLIGAQKEDQQDLDFMQMHKELSDIKREYKNRMSSIYDNNFSDDIKKYKVGGTVTGLNWWNRGMNRIYNVLGNTYEGSNLGFTSDMVDLTPLFGRKRRSLSLYDNDDDKLPDDKLPEDSHKESSNTHNSKSEGDFWNTKFGQRLSNFGNKFVYNLGKGIDMGGIIYGMNAANKNFKGWASTLRPYKNFYANFGKKSMANLDGEQKNINTMNDWGKRQLQMAVDSAALSNENNATNINTARAVRLGLLSEQDNAIANLASQMADRQNQLEDKRSELNKLIDEKVMGGDQWADSMNRQQQNQYWMQKLNADNVTAQGLQRISSRIDGIAGNRLTSKDLLAYLDSIKEKRKK